MPKNLLRVALISLVSLLLFWGPFIGKIQKLWGIEFGRQGMNVVVQNFDGLNFLVIAKSWYSPGLIEQINAQFLTGNDPLYFSAHFPLFVGLIKVFDVILPLPQALFGAIAVSNVLLAGVLYSFFVTVSKDQKLAVLLSIIALFFPARILSTRGVGSNEPLFIALTLVSLTYMIKHKYWPSAIAGALAVLTRSPGILLFAAYVLALWRRPKDLVPYLLMPAALLSLFAFYGWSYHDPLAYFHSGDNLHLFFPPFQIFSNTASWINDMWREDIIYLYVFYGAGIMMIDKNWAGIKKWGVVYGLTLLLVAHRDLARYARHRADCATGLCPVTK
jgi:Gpi18-like mannosyltransferase